MKCFHAENCVTCTNCDGCQLKKASLNYMWNFDAVYFVTILTFCVRVGVCYQYSI
jgi:hypothetical protein